MRRPLGIAAAGIAALTTVVIVVLVATSSPPSSTTVPSIVDAATTSTSEGSSTSTTETTIPATTTEPGPPPPPEPYVVPEHETAREGKQLAVDIATVLTTYEETDHPPSRFIDIAGIEGAELLGETAETLTYPGLWSRGAVIYPQLGGLTDDKVSVMVVLRQTVGSGVDASFSVVRTLDVRLVMGESGWEFDHLASAGGMFASLEDLALAHAVASDPRIEMPDSARQDILDGGVSPILLEVMLELADITPYGVTVMATGHPFHVFETNRVSHHSIGRAIDIYRVGDQLVIDDRASGSLSSRVVQWIWEQNRVVQVGSPWNIDGGSRRSFTNTVHQDHIHMAVVSPTDPLWVPAIGDRVWDDLDADGIQDSGEPGIPGVTVHLFDSRGVQIGTTVTDSSGKYEFRDLSWGEHHVEIEVPFGYLISPRNQGSNDRVDSDINASGVMATTSLDPREHDTSWDAGLYRLASIGDRVWEDLDGDGLQDGGEPGIQGVTVRLFNGQGIEVASTVTNASGGYAFTDLEPGTYHIEIDIPSGYQATPADQGSDDALDSDIDAAGSMPATSLVSGENDTRWDAGVYRPASIGDRVWEDLDGDGIQDAGEPGVAGVTVRLFRNGSQVASTVTDANGEFQFAGRRPGAHHLVIDIPDGFVASPRDQGSDDATDSDIDADGVMATTTLVSGEVDDRWDAGIRLAP